MTDFTQRHLGAVASDRVQMLSELGFTSLDELTDAVVPAPIRLGEPLSLPAPLTEFAAQRELAALAAQNHPGLAMIGLGYHGTITPPAIRRLVLENPAWYTAYTPYQPEISQGRLEALANFQTVISDLTGLPVAGASLLDEGTAVAEAVAVAHRVSRKGGVVVVDPQLLPQSLAVLRTRCLATGVEIVVAGESLADTVRATQCFAVVVQVPGADGALPGASELTALAQLAHDNGAQLIAAVDLLALTLIGSAASWGVDIAVGSAQRFGVPLFYGGPHAGFIAVRAGLERQLPGRIVGISKDADGVAAFRLALQTREQHIRREKATSNICTAQVLLAVTAGSYAIHHGPTGLARIARTVHDRTRRLAAVLVAGGLELHSETFFD
ncbi:MAG: glycine dehydrogenase (aminomethyl-transferring), partial [Propionicimonas sp.]